jgi:hypothetical protein
MEVARGIGVSKLLFRPFDKPNRHPYAQYEFDEWGEEMDFIERLFRMRPDGGSGAYELFLILVPVLAVTFREFTAYRARRRQMPNRYPGANG